MRIKINANEWGTLRDDQPTILIEEEIGLRYVENSRRTMFDVIDKELFFLSVIKYGISFTDFTNANTY